MGKASSAKKVARAARSGKVKAKSTRPAASWFALSLVAVLVLGGLLVTYARTTRSSAGAAELPPSPSEHWQAPYGLYVCDQFLPPLTEVNDTGSGIGTKTPGIISIRPTGSGSSGTNARMKLFAEQVGLTFSSTGFKMPDGTEHKTGDQCNGKPATFGVYKWKLDDPSAPIEVFETDPANIAFTENRAAYTFAVLPEGSGPPPQPPSAESLTSADASSPADSP